MNVLLTKKLPATDLELLKSWGWNVSTIETLEISIVDVDEIPKANAWVVSSRNSLSAVKKFIDQAPGNIYCIGNWMKEELLKAGAKSTIRSFENMERLAGELAGQPVESILYFCGEEHRQELERGLKNTSITILKVVTHKSRMTFPIVKGSFDAVFVFSPRSCESLLRHNSFPGQTIFACIGPSTANFLTSKGITNTLTASYPDSTTLLKEFHSQILNINP